MNSQQFSEAWTPEPFSNCWLWTKGQNGRGYGFAVWNGINTLAHRVAWALYKGEIPQASQVLHRCDTPSCVNPDHLFLGSRSDNMRDAFQKGRHKGNKKVFRFFPNPPHR